MASRGIAEGEYIINNTFMYKVSLLLQSEFRLPLAPTVKHEVCVTEIKTDVSKGGEIRVIASLHFWQPKVRFITSIYSSPFMYLT